MRPRWWRQRKHLEDRVDSARGEVETSKRLLDQAREEVVKPLRRAAEHNQFAEMIRNSLLEGRNGAS